MKNKDSIEEELLDEEIVELLEEEGVEDIEEEYFIAQDLLDFLDTSVTMYHAVEEASYRLEEGGFERLELTENWKLESGNRYYLVVNDSTVIAFVAGKNKKSGFRIVGAHSDSPGFKVKANPVMDKYGYTVLNTEIYGGPILSSWFDRPLSLAGRVYLKGETSHKPKMKLFNFDYDLMTIPSLAIHMTRDVKETTNINAQEHTLPVLGLSNDFDLNELIADELEVDVDDIICHELFVYNREKANLFGANTEFLQSGRLDNLPMFHAGLNAIINVIPTNNTQLFVAFDNEEIGSGTLQGAQSTMFRDVLRKISIAFGNDEAEFINQIYNSYMISSDQAHSIHPNYIHKADPTNRPLINHGPVIKDAARKSYATDGFGRAVLIDIAEKNDIPIQYFYNRSDLRGGSTIGSIIEVKTGIRNIDIGNPMLAMHSAREMMGVKDHKYMLDLMLGFYEAE